MYLGQIVEIGTKEQVFNTPRHPYSKALLSSHLFPDLDHRRVERAERLSLKGEIPSPINLPKGCYLYGRCPSQVDAAATCHRFSRAAGRAQGPLLAGRAGEI